MGNRLTGEDRDLITSKLTLAEPDQAVPGSGGYLVQDSGISIPFSSEFSADIRRLLGKGLTVVRSWDVLWPADGSAPRVFNDNRLRA